MTDRAAHTNAGAPAVLPRWRSGRPGRPLTGLSAWAAWIPAGALVLGIGLIAGAAVWPLAGPDATEAAAPAPVPNLSTKRLTVGERETALAKLTEKNPFSIDGRFWIAKPVAEVEDDEATDSTGDPIAAGGGSTSPGGSTPTPGAGQPILTQSDEMPADIKPAFDNLKLQGVRIDAAGEPVVMFVTVQNLTQLREQRVGSEFVDEKFPQAKWTVESIDTTRDRIVLARAGKRVSLALYPAEPMPVEPIPASDAPPTSPSASTAIVVTSTRDEILAQLRKDGVTEEEIAQLMKLVDADPAAFAGASGQTKADTPASDAPAGIADVVRLMQSVGSRNEKPANDPPKPPQR